MLKKLLTPAQQAFADEARAFVQQEIAPQADQNDQQEYTPLSCIHKIAERGYLGALIPQTYGGPGIDMLSLGLLHAEFGQGCSSLRSLLTVHSMVAHALARWGNQEQKAFWLPRLASGEAIAAFALSEPGAGSDVKSMSTTAVRQGNAFILQGTKKWITYGQVAHVFLVFARLDENFCAFLVESNTPGLSIKPIKGLLGTRASMLAEVQFDRCVVPQEQLIGKVGFGFAAVANSCLDLGRYSVAWGSTGISQACLEASLQYSAQRRQFGVLLREQQLIQSMLTDMLVQTDAARLLCYYAGYLRERGDPEMLQATWSAKYFASTAALRIANDAVQIHGANGCSSDYSVQRYLRDAKIMQIIEGSTQIQQITIAGFGHQGMSWGATGSQGV